MFVGNDDCQSRARFRDDHTLEVTGKRDCNAKAANQECRRVPAHFLLLVLGCEPNARERCCY